MIGILTDTTASIPGTLAHKLHIQIVPYYVHRGLETLRDVVDVQPAEFAGWLQRATRLPTTSNPAPGDYLIGMQDGVIVALGTARSRIKAYRRMVELMQQRVGENAKSRSRTCWHEGRWKSCARRSPTASSA